MDTSPRLSRRAQQALATDLAPLWIRNFLQVCIKMHTAASGNLELPLPIFESRLVHQNHMLALRDLHIGRRVAHETAVDLNVGTGGFGAQLQLC